jgi:uncharacterized iron-regulated membrane protein
MTVRKLHGIVAITIAPFLLLLVLTGSSLFFRNAGIYEKEIKEFLVSIHTWEIVAPYVGIVFGIGLLFLVISGTILFFNKRA